MLRQLIIVLGLIMMLEFNALAQQPIMIQGTSNGFTPSMLQASSGDQIQVVLLANQSFTQVSKQNWLSNGNTPLSGGINFATGSGGGTFTLSGTDTIYYVSSSQASIGYKGRIAVSVLAGVKDPLNLRIQELNVFPNPGKETATLTFYLPRPGTVEIAVINAIGKKAKNIAIIKTLPDGEQSIQLDLHGLPQGMYFVEVSYNSHKYVKRLYVVND